MKKRATPKRRPVSTALTEAQREALSQLAFVPDDQPLDLTKAEKIRTTALLMAINYVRETICGDAQMYQALKADGKQLIPATTPFVLQSALQFELFLLGRYSEGAPLVSNDAPPADGEALDAGTTTG